MSLLAGFGIYAVRLRQRTRAGSSGGWRSHGPFPTTDLDLPSGYSRNGLTGNSRRAPVVHVNVTDLDWTDSMKVCDPAEVRVTDPMLVVRRHVDLLRVHSAICRLAR